MAQKEPEVDDVTDKELKARPITTEFTEFTDEQFNVRLAFAKKICAYLLETDDTLDAKMKTIYEKYPMWGFYTDEKHIICKRSFGVAVSEDGKNILHTQMAMSFFDNTTVGGTPADTLVRVDQWNENQIKFIKHTANPGLYLDPLGFYLVLLYHSS